MSDGKSGPPISESGSATSGVTSARGSRAGSLPSTGGSSPASGSPLPWALKEEPHVGKDEVVMPAAAVTRHLLAARVTPPPRSHPVAPGLCCRSGALLLRLPTPQAQPEVWAERLASQGRQPPRGAPHPPSPPPPLTAGRLPPASEPRGARRARRNLSPPQRSHAEPAGPERTLPSSGNQTRARSSRAPSATPLSKRAPPSHLALCAPPPRHRGAQTDPTSCAWPTRWYAVGRSGRPPNRTTRSRRSRSWAARPPPPAPPPAEACGVRTGPMEGYLGQWEPLEAVRERLLVLPCANESVCRSSIQ